MDRTPDMSSATEEGQVSGTGAMGSGAIVLAKALPGDAAKAQPRKRKASWIPAVAAWATVVLDRRRKQNKLIEKAPAIVSRVDMEGQTVHLLYPNMITEFLDRKGQGVPMLFTIESHPLARVRAWEQDTRELNKILQRALLCFAEQRGAAMRLGRTLQAMDSPAAVMLDARGQRAMDDPQTVAERLKLQLANSNFGGAAPGSEEESDIDPAQAAALEPPEKEPPEEEAPVAPAAAGVSPASSSGAAGASAFQSVSPAASLAQVQTPQPSWAMPGVALETPQATKVAAPESTPPSHSPPEGSRRRTAQQAPLAAGLPPHEVLREFTARLARLFSKSAEGRLAKDTVRSELARDFPQWEQLLVVLEDGNKVMVVDQVIFQI